MKTKDETVLSASLEENIASCEFSDAPCTAGELAEADDSNVSEGVSSDNSEVGVEATSELLTESDDSDASQSPIGAESDADSANAEEAITEDQPASRDVLHFTMPKQGRDDVDLLSLFDAPDEDATEDAAAETDATPKRSHRKISFSAEPCTRSAGSGCTRCVTVCPAQAIQIDASAGDHGMPVIDDEICNGCGICISICDSFSSASYTTEDYARRMLRHANQAADEGKEKSITLCCEKDLPESIELAINAEALPCLSSLSPEFLTWLLAQGLKVELCHDPLLCEGCETGGRFGGALWKRATQIAEEWSGKEIGATDTLPEKQGLVDQFAEPDRRELFSGMIKTAENVASGSYRASKSSVIEDFLTRREQMRAQSRATQREASYLDEESREKAMRSHFARKTLLEEAIEIDPLIRERMGETRTR